MVAISLGVTVRGSPPRVRSRRRSHRLCERWPGITSACAEQTPIPLVGNVSAWDHLRVCGADSVTVWESGNAPGSPPRVRSRRPDPAPSRRPHGITSACAEQTVYPSRVGSAGWDHLRVCGADPALPLLTDDTSGSPPRVRSRHRRRLPWSAGSGITSACAEQTVMGMSLDLAGGDHLRVCGADPCDCTGGTVRSGSPPRVRSRHHRAPRHRQRLRITSACAEQTSW